MSALSIMKDISQNLKECLKRASTYMSELAVCSIKKGSPLKWSYIT